LWILILSNVGAHTGMRLGKLFLDSARNWLFCEVEI